MYGPGPCERGQEVVGEGGDGKDWDGVAGGYLGRGGQVSWGGSRVWLSWLLIYRSCAVDIGKMDTG